MSTMIALVCAAVLLLVAFMLVRRVAGRTAMKLLAETPEVFYPARPATFLVSRYPSFVELDSGPELLSYDESRAEMMTADGTGVAPARLPQSLPRAVSMDIRTFLQSRVPSLYQEFSPTWWLPSGHLQTVYVAMGDFSTIDPIEYERTLIQTPDGGTLGLDETPVSKDAPDLSPDTPIVVVQHGLTGGSYEAYIRCVLYHVCTPKRQGGLGYRAIVINFRGCATVPITSPQFYSAGHTDDLRCGLLYISHKYPNAPLIGIGFSLGANILTRYLGEEGPRSRLAAGLALACPWDIVKNSDRLDSGFVAREVYSKSLGRNIQNLFRSHESSWRRYPEDEVLAQRMEHILSVKNPTFRQMDISLISTLGGSRPPFPFNDLYEYYRWASSHKSIRNIRVPYLALNAMDDPIVASIPTGETEHSLMCALAVTKRGGHLGWFQGGDFGAGLWGGARRKLPTRYFCRPAMEFLRACAEDLMDSRVGARSETDRVARNGFVIENGNEFVGFKLVQDEPLIHGSGDVPSRDIVVSNA